MELWNVWSQRMFPVQPKDMWLNWKHPSAPHISYIHETPTQMIYVGGPAPRHTPPIPSHFVHTYPLPTCRTWASSLPSVRELHGSHATEATSSRTAATVGALGGPPAPRPPPRPP